MPDTSTELRTVSLPVMPMTPESFAPYGELLDAPDRPGHARAMAPCRFEHQGRVTTTVIWQPHGDAGFTRLERHFAVTQTFVQLDGPPAVVCVARPTALDDPAAAPAPEEISALRIDPARGWSFHIGTWHSLDRFVLAAPGATFLIINVAPNPTQIVDYAEGSSVTYRDLDVDGAPTRASLPAIGGVRFVLES